MNRKFLLSALAVLVAIPLPLQAQLFNSQSQNTRLTIAPSASGPARIWNKRAPALIVGRETGEWDGQPVAYRTWTTGPLKLRLARENLEDWTPASGPHRYSDAFEFRWHKSVVLGIAAFPQSALLSDLDAQWNDYLAGLVRQYGNRLTWLCNDDSATNPNMLRIMGQRTRVLEYLIQPANKEEAPRAFAETFVFCGGYLWVFALEGPAPVMAGRRPAYEAIVRDFEPVLPPVAE